MAKNFGNCKGCRHFDTNASNPGDRDEARCRQNELMTFELLVTGASGCNRFEARAEAGGAQRTPTPPA